MRIDGITTCAGPLYADYLAKSLPVWLDTLDSLTVVYDAYTYAIGKLEYEGFANRDGARCPFSTVQSDAFTRNGAKFNKGAALNEGIAAAAPRDWVLCFDCDILPPPYWREVVAAKAERGALNFACRYQSDGRETDRTWEPRGYFQLWHASDCRRSPPYSEEFPDAGGYDTEFGFQWPHHHMLTLRLTHLGEKARHWCGPNASPEENFAAVAAANLRRSQSVAAQ